MSRQSGSHRYWKVEQVYLSKDTKKRLFVKYNVGLSSAEPIGGWIKIKKSQVLHLRKGKSVVAYMAQGFSSVELYELQKQLSQSSKKIAEAVWNPFMNCAHAEVTSNPMGDGIGYVEEQWTPSETPTEEGESSMLSRAANVAKCVGGETMGKVMDVGKQVWENATLENAWEVVPTKEEVTNGLWAAWEAIPTWEETKQGAAAVGSAIAHPIATGEAIWDGVGKAYDDSMKLIAGIYQKVKEVVVGFANLTADVADYLICQITSFLIQEGSMNAAMSVLTGGGAIGLAMAKMTASIVRFAGKLKPLMPAFKGLSKASLSSEERLEKAAKIMKGEMSEDEVARLAGDARNPAEEGLTAANAGSTIAEKIEGLRGLSASEKDMMLKASGSLSDTGRVSAASSALARPLSKTESDALLRAHNVAPERGYKTYTQADLKEKTRILREAGFSQQEADLLMRQGLAGQYGMYGSIEIRTNAASAYDIDSTNALQAGPAVRRQAEYGFGVDASNPAASRPDTTAAIKYLETQYSKIARAMPMGRPADANYAWILSKERDLFLEGVKSPSEAKMIVDQINRRLVNLPEIKKAPSGSNDRHWYEIRQWEIDQLEYAKKELTKEFKLTSP
ncbi:hypothetical protein K2X05_08470 [bacterium]|nr:hypothetical protein [bacterium]